MAGGYQNPAYGMTGAGTAASGGKGGMMGGFDPNSMAGAGKGGESLGSSGAGSFLPDAGLDMSQSTSTPVAPAAPAAPAAPQGPNAFEQGLGAQDNAMAFFQNAMGGGSQQIMNMIADMSRGSGGGQPMYMGGGGSMPKFEAESIARDVYDYDPANVQAAGYTAAQLADANLDPYMNPYTQDVIDTTMSDLGRARDSAMNATGLAATQGGAFGGDRHAIMESQNNADYMRQAASTSASLRNQGFQNAQNAAMADINSLNQQRGFDAQAQQAASMANAQSANERSQFVGSTANNNALQKQQIEAQMAMKGGGGGGGGTNYAQMAQIKAQKQQTALQAAMSMYGMQFDAANQLYGMGQDRWGMGEDATNSMANVGSQIDGINQNLIDAVKGQWDQQMGAPQNQFNNYLAALAGAPGQGGQSTTYNPGKMDFLGMGTQLGAAALMGSDVRLKENIQKVATVNGINLYSWDWNEDGKSNFPGQKPFGVLAQEIAETKPEAVVENADGWLMVDYAKLPEVCPAVMGAQHV